MAVEALLAPGNYIVLPPANIFANLDDWHFLREQYDLGQIAFEKVIDDERPLVIVRAPEGTVWHDSVEIMTDSYLIAIVPEAIVTSDLPLLLEVDEHPDGEGSFSTTDAVRVVSEEPLKVVYDHPNLHVGDEHFSLRPPDSEE